MREVQGQEQLGMASKSSQILEDAQTSYREILFQQILQGKGEIERSTGGLLLSGLSAGMDIGFSTFLMAVMLTLVEDQLPPAIVQLLVANMYAVGFIFVIVGRSELFTEHTTLAIFPLLARRASFLSVGRLWALVYVSNLVGAAIFAVLAVYVGSKLGVTDNASFGRLAAGMVKYDSSTILLSAVLAGWLMGLLSWLIKAARDTISQVVIVWLITSVIGLSHLHHSIVGTVEVVAGMWSSSGIPIRELFRFLLWATLGNALGGGLFVALIKFSHSAKPGGDASDPEMEEEAIGRGISDDARSSEKSE